MGMLMEEYGMALVYAVIGVFMVTLICWTYKETLYKLMPEYINENDKSSKDTARKYQEILSRFHADDVLFAEEESEFTNLYSCGVEYEVSNRNVYDNDCSHVIMYPFFLVYQLKRPEICGT